MKELKTEKAHLWWAIGIVLGALIKHFLKDFPYWEFGSFWTLGFLGVGAKRLLQRHEKFNGHEYPREGSGE